MTSESLRRSRKLSSGSGGFWDAREGFLRRFSGASWRVLGSSWGLLGGLFGGFLWASWRPLGASLGRLGGLRGALVAILVGKARNVNLYSPSCAPLRVLLGLSRAVLGAAGTVLALSWAVLRPSWPLGPSWGGLGVLSDRLPRREGREVVYAKSSRFLYLGAFLGSLFKASWAILECSWAVLGYPAPSRRFSEVSWRSL